MILLIQFHNFVREMKLSGRGRLIFHLNTLNISTIDDILNILLPTCFIVTIHWYTSKQIIHSPINSTYKIVRT